LVREGVVESKILNKIHITYTFKPKSGGIYPLYQIKYLFIYFKSRKSWFLVPLKLAKCSSPISRKVY